MFDMFYRSLSANKKKEFQASAGLSADIIKNAYLPKDTLKRKIPRPETSLAMIRASEGKLTVLMLADYFYVSTVNELDIADRVVKEKRIVKRNISVTHTEV